MGIFQKIASNSERKIIAAVIEELGQANVGAVYGELPLPCHIIDEKHSGIYFRISESESLGLFRCQMRWWAYRLTELELTELTSDRWEMTYAMLRLVNKPSDFCAFGRTAELYQNLIARAIRAKTVSLVETLKKLGAEEPLAVEFASQAVSAAFDEANKFMAGKPPVAEVGTKYVEGSVPSNPLEHAFISILQKYEADRDSDDVADSDVINHWDKGHFDREFVLARDNAIVLYLSTAVMQSKDWPSEDVMWDAVADWKKKNRPIYGLASKDAYSLEDQNRPLPIELAERINRFLESLTPKQATQARKCSSFNAYIRQCISEGLL